MIRVHIGAFRPAALAAGGLAALVLSAGIAAAQTFGFATMQPGTLNHTSASAVAKVLKDKAGLNVVVQPTAGEFGYDSAGCARRSRVRHREHLRS